MSRSPGAIRENATPHRHHAGSAIAGLLDERRATTVRDAERRFPVRIRIAVPPEGLGGRLDQIIAWLDANCGADSWISTPSSTRGVVNDALAVYFVGVTMASAFVGQLVRRTEGRDCGWGCIGSAMTNRHSGSVPLYTGRHRSAPVVMQASKSPATHHLYPN